MRFVKTTLMGMGGIALVVLLLVPKAAHAVVATLVQVANTTSNPVPNADVNGPGQEVFQTQICISTQSSSCFSSPTSFVVPASTSDGASVKRLVLTTVTGTCSSNQQPGTSLLESFIEISAGGTSLLYTSPLQLSPGSFSAANNFQYAIMGPAPLYADPGTTVGAFSTAADRSVCTYDLAGYYVTH